MCELSFVASSCSLQAKRATCTIPRVQVVGQPRCRGSHKKIQVAATSTVVAPSKVGNPLTGKVGKAGGDDGDGPTPEEQAQVFIYRTALVVMATSWWVMYSLDFFMTTGVSLIDGSVQSAALSLADACAGIAALFAPTGSALAAGVLMRLCGLASLLSVLFGAAGPGTIGAVVGPASVVLICAREIFWFGLAYKIDALICIFSFAAVAILRASSITVNEVGFSNDANSTMTLQQKQTETADGVLWNLPSIQPEVQPVGPPIPLSFVASVGVTVMSFGKIFEPVGEDLDEEGEQWNKRSSDSLYGDDDVQGETDRGES